MTSFYTEKELSGLGLKAFGRNVLISRKASIYSPGELSVGNNVRIDDFCILSGTITIGNYVHIGPYCGLFAGEAGIELKDFAGMSSRCNIYAVSDDFLGSFLTSPVVPAELRQITEKKIVFEKHSGLGCACTLLPGAYLSEGSVLGAMSMLCSKSEPWKVYFGIPAKPIKNRKKTLLDLAKRLQE
jgi:galactoside O-acetyltransferase